MKKKKPTDKQLLALIRENGIGANSDDLEDAIRQVLQVAIASRDNYAELERKLAEERARLDRVMRGTGWRYYCNPGAAIDAAEKE